MKRSEKQGREGNEHPIKRRVSKPPGASLVAQTVKVSAGNAGDPGSIPGSERSPGEGNGNPLQYSCLEKSQGPRSLVGYSPWGRKESDTTEELHFTYSLEGKL